MALSRAQRHMLATRAKRQANKARPLTRKEAHNWLSPARKTFTALMQGEVDAIRGYPVTRLHTGDDYARIDYCINGFLGLTDRVMPHVDTAPWRKVSRQLENGVPLLTADLTHCLDVLKQVEAQLMSIPRHVLVDASTVEQIGILADEMGLTEAAWS